MKNDRDSLFWVDPAPEPIDPPEHVRIVLIQAREPDDPMRGHELRCFARHMHLHVDRLEVFNLLERGLDEFHGVLEDSNARLLIGGSGSYSVSKKSPEPLERFVVDLVPLIVDKGLPTFGSCWGYHALAAGMGGSVERTGRVEVGTHPVRRIGGVSDPLIDHLPERFEAQMGHNDWVTRLPGGVEPLCENDLSPHQAVRFGEAPVYGIQFHAELDHVANRNRYLHYLEHYGGEDDGSTRFEPSPHPTTLLRRFLDLYCLDAEEQDHGVEHGTVGGELEGELPNDVNQRVSNQPIASRPTETTEDPREDPL